MVSENCKLLDIKKIEEYRNGNKVKKLLVDNVSTFAFDI